MNLLDLPLEILLIVLTYLQPQDLISLTLTCKSMRIVNELIRPIVKSNPLFKLINPTIVTNINWIRLYNYYLSNDTDKILDYLSEISPFVMQLGSGKYFIELLSRSTDVTLIGIGDETELHYNDHGALNYQANIQRVFFTMNMNYHLTKLEIVNCTLSLQCGYTNINCSKFILKNCTVGSCTFNVRADYSVKYSVLQTVVIEGNTFSDSSVRFCCDSNYPGNNNIVVQNNNWMNCSNQLRGCLIVDSDYPVLIKGNTFDCPNLIAVSLNIRALCHLEKNYFENVKYCAKVASKSQAQHIVFTDNKLGDHEDVFQFSC